jgi:predicted DNA-binding transcriptional regulator AlpA
MLPPTDDLFDATRATSPTPPGDLMTTRELAAWLGTTAVWLEVGRHAGYGPKFLRLSARQVRYARADVLAWLATRRHERTAEYAP